jgi:hypothetical protein
MLLGFITQEIRGVEDLDRVVGGSEAPVILVEGTRELSPERAVAAERCAARLARRYPAARFRTGNAPGSDEAFAAGVAQVDAARLEVVLPYAGHRAKYVRPGSSRYALDGLSQAAEERVVEQTEATDGALGRLARLYQKSGRTTAAGNKAAYLLRDALKVTGAAEAGLAPATVGIFHVCEDDPLAGGTGFTVRMCLQHRVPVVTQAVWLRWLTQE